jgi:hypothetical protein
VKVRIGVRGQVVVDGKVDTLNVNAATEDIGSDADALVEFLELLVPANTVLMSVTIQ